MSKDDRLDFFVRWKNFSPDDNTWENFEFFAHDAPELAQKYITRVFTAYKVPRNTKNFE